MTFLQLICQLFVFILHKQNSIYHEFVSNYFFYPIYPIKIWNNWLPLKINIFSGYLDTLITCAVLAKAQHNLFLFFKHAAHRRRQQDRGINFRIDSFIQRPLLSAMIQAEFSSKSMESWRRGKKLCVLYNGLKLLLKEYSILSLTRSKMSANLLNVLTY